MENLTTDDLKSYDKKYDPDEIFVTSTVGSEQEETYLAKTILATGVRKEPDGTKAIYYLVKWDGYPLDRYASLDRSYKPT